jgi:stearoyl-CoA desaturase (delta-9 desaturase)
MGMNWELLGWATLWGFLWCQVVTHYGVSVGLHRYFAHSQFKTSVAHEWGFIIMIMIACVRTPIGWVSSHRMHHYDTEGPLDPHNYKEIGYWKVATTTWDIHHVPVKFARDLYDNPRLVFAHTYWKEFLIGYWMLCLLISPYFWWGAAFMPYIFAKVGFGMLNIFGHWNGPTDGVWMNWILGGDGYHKVHHEHPRKLILGKYDLGGRLAKRYWAKR